MSVRLIVDSSSDLLEQVRERVKVMPLAIRFGNDEYLDGVTITSREFYEKLAASKSLPTTSQVTPFAFQQAYEEILAAGDSAVVITLSSKLSGTYQSAMLAAEDYPGKVFVVDSRTVAIGAGVLIQYALELADRGLCAEDVYQGVLEAREHVRLFAVLDTLEYLQKGGRISKAVALAGGLLAVKPIVSVREGEVQMIGKARGNRQANAAMNREILQVGVDKSMPFQLGYTGTEDSLLQKYRQESREFWDEDTPACCVGSGVGTYAGPGVVAAAFFG